MSYLGFNHFIYNVYNDNVQYISWQEKEKLQKDNGRKLRSNVNIFTGDDDKKNDR